MMSGENHLGRLPKRIDDGGREELGGVSRRVFSRRERPCLSGERVRWGGGEGELAGGVKGVVVRRGVCRYEEGKAARSHPSNREKKSRGESGQKNGLLYRRPLNC